MLAKRIISFAMALLMLMLTVPVMAFTALAEAADGGYTYSYTDIANRLIDPKYLSMAAVRFIMTTALPLSVCLTQSTR